MRRASFLLGTRARHSDVERSAQVAAHATLMAGAIQYVGHPAIRNRGTVCGSLAHADPSAVALALDAEMVVAGPDGERRTPAAAFFHGVFTTDLEATEVLTAVHVPAAAVGTGWSVQELSRRHGDFALAGAPAVLRLAPGGTVAAVGLAPFGVAPTPVPIAEAEQMVVGEKPDPGLFAAAAVRAVDPLADLHGSSAYRRHLAGLLVRQSLTEAAACAEIAA